MKNKTVLVIVVVALAMFAYIFFIDRDTMSTSDLEGRKDRVFKEFNRDMVTAVTVSGSKGEVAVEKATGGDGEERWKMTSPAGLAADASAVRSVLSAIDFLLADRTVATEGEAEKPRYGLSDPRVTISFEMRGGAKTTFKVGASDSSGEKVYVALEGAKEFHAVEKDFLDSVDVGPSDLRDKHLFDQDMELDGALGATVRRADSTIELERDGVTSPWMIRRGEASILAAADQVNELLRDVGRLRADEFLGDGADDADMKKYGLDEPSRKVTVRLGEGEKTVVFGSPCGEGDGGIAASVVGSGTVACVPSKISDLLDRPASRFEEMRPAIFVDGDVDRITMTRQGKTLSLEWDDDDEKWRLSGTDDDAMELEPAAVRELLDALSSSRATKLTVGPEASADPGAPSAVVTLALDAGRDPVELELWPASGDDGAVSLRRKGEEAILTFKEDILSMVNPDPLGFRNRTIENGDPEDVTKLVLEGPAPQTLTSKDGSWTLASPVEANADDGAARDLARFAARLEVERYASPSALPAQGFDRPWAVLRATLSPRAEDGDEKGDAQEGAGEKTVVIEIGSKVKDGEGRFGRIVGGKAPIFVVSAADVDRISRPVVARNLVQIDAGTARKIEITRQGEGDGWSAALVDGQWVSEQRPDLDSVTLKRLLVDLGTFKAVRATSFDVETGFETTTLGLKVYGEDGSDPQEMVVGSRSADESEDAYLARKAGLSVSFAVPARLVDDFLAL